MKNADKPDLDFFERKVVFRTARGYFLFIAVTAILTFVGGVFMGASGLIYTLPDEPVEPAPPPEVPRPTPLTVAEIEAFKAQQNDQAVDTVEGPEPEFAAINTMDSGESEQQKRKRRLEDVLAELKALFPTPQYVWSNTYETTCARSSPYGCLKREKKLVKQGVGVIINQGLTKDEDEYEQLMPLLEDIVHALKQAPVEKRGELILPAMEAHRGRWNRYHRESLDQQLERTRMLQRYEEAVAEHGETVAEIEANKSNQQLMGVYAVLVGLGCLVFVGVFLAHLAIERHLREMREIVADQGRIS